MAVVAELLRKEENGGISFGNYALPDKHKLEITGAQGDLLKVKTYNEITKLEKNGMFLYESVPGTSVTDFVETEEGVSFTVEGPEDAQITIGLSDDTSYEVFVDDVSVGTMNTGLSGKLSISVELGKVDQAVIKVCRK